MSVGTNIKKLRELKNYTQAYMAEQLELSLSGYGKIERDETDITLTRLSEIAQILETDCSTILNFNERHVFNFTNNENANGIVHNQHLDNNLAWKELVGQLRDEISFLRSKIV